jgi:hypothetical protein
MRYRLNLLWSFGEHRVPKTPRADDAFSVARLRNHPREALDHSLHRRDFSARCSTETILQTLQVPFSD